MPLVTAPNDIEASDFSLGWTPDLEESSVPPQALLEVLNLLPDVGSGALQTRKGFKRIAGAAALDGYNIRTITPFNFLSSSDSDRYLILVATTTANAVDNIKVMSYHLGTDTLTRINTAGVNWADASGLHYGFSAPSTTGLSTFYGGAELGEAYSWNPTDGWDQTDVMGYSRPAFSATKAYREGDEVSSGSREFALSRSHKEGDGIRFKKWVAGTSDLDEDAEFYAHGEKVSLKIGGEWQSFKCVKGHLSFDSFPNEPGTGAGKWKRMTVPAPVDEDGKINGWWWNEIPDAPITNLAVWHAGRMFGRHDNRNKQTLMYSTAAQQKEGVMAWNPRDWNAKLTTGAGFQAFFTGEGDRITALKSFGHYLIIFTLRNCFVIAGHNPETWQIRQVAPRGAANMRATAEHDGLVYFISDEGFYYTDGTQVQEVPGSEGITEWIREMVNWAGNLDSVTLWSFEDFLWMSLPTGIDNKPDRTIVYDPGSKSFWKLDLPIQAVCVNRRQGVERMFFTIPNKTGAHKTATYAWTGAANRSSSTRTIAAVVETNLLKNPSFEARASGHGAEDWVKTDTIPQHVVETPTAQAARRGKKGLELTYNRIEGWISGIYADYAGVYQNIADVDGTSHNISAYVRRNHWKKHKGAPAVKFLIDETKFDPDTTTSVGRGWYRVSKDYTGSATPRKHGILTLANRTIEVDQAMVVDGPKVSYFDGGGGAESGAHAVVGGGRGLVFQYDHEDAADQDDTGEPTYAGEAIGWFMRSAWFPFGAQREERRIRRIWAIVRGKVTFLMRGFRNYEGVHRFSTETTLTDDVTADYIEGEVGDIPDSYSVSLRVEGDSAPAAVQSLAINTQPRRVRFHS